MKTRIINFIFIASLLNSFTFGENKYPIVLVHGFLGWGPEEMGGYPYWGGELNFETYLRSLGYEVITVSVGPVSSNWERAVEVLKTIVVNFFQSQSYTPIKWRPSSTIWKLKS